jgi:hypothetical protein
MKNLNLYSTLKEIIGAKLKNPNKRLNNMNISLFIKILR